MAIAIDPKEVFDYVLREDRNLPPERQTVFHLQRMSFGQRAVLENKTVLMDRKTDAIHSLAGTVNEQTLRAGLKGWDNFCLPSGIAVEFRTEGKRINVLGVECDPPTFDTLGHLHPRYVAEIAEVIRERLTDDDQKN